MNETGRNSERYEVLIRHPRRIVVEKLSKVSKETRLSREGIAAVLDSSRALKGALMIILEEDAELLAISRNGEKLEESFVREVTEA